MNDWPELTLDQCLASLIDYRGKSPRKSTSGIPVISAKVVKSGRILHPIEQTIDPDYYSEWMRRGLPLAGDVVLTTEGPLGEVAQLNADTAKYALGQRVVVLRGRAGVLDNTYLRFLLQSQVAQQRLHSFATGTTVAGISQKSLRQVPLPVPPLHQQLLVADLLGSLDDKIELNRRMNETLEAMAQAIYRDWFVDFGPTRRKLEGATDPVTIMGGLVQDAERARALADFFPSDIGNNDQPDTWKSQIIYDCCDVIYGAPFASDRFNAMKNGRPLARIRDLPSNVGGVYTDEVHPKEHQIAAGNIVVGMDGEFRAYLWHGEPTLMNQRVCSFVPKPNRSRAFLLFSLRPLLAICEATAVGTTVIHLGKKDIDRFNVLAAPEDLEASFASIVEPMLDLVVSNGAQSRTLAATRDLLLPKLMSGEIRLREAEDVLEAAQ